MADAGKDWLEAIILRNAYEETPIKILSIETSGSSGVITKGDNYMSTIRKIQAKVLMGSGKVKTLSFIVKTQHDTEFMRKLSIDSGVFRREIAMYRDVFDKMEGLLDEIGDLEGAFWPKCYDIQLYDRLIFEDLGQSGYRMADRKVQLGLEPALLVVRHLAKFHALARILLDRGEIPVDILEKSIYRVTEPMFLNMTNENVRRFTAMMDRRWGEEWKDAVRRINKVDNIAALFLKAVDRQPEEFTTLCHGDCWTNNMMFKGDIQHPTSIKFVDFQLSYICSPARDLVYFLTSSVNLGVRTANFDLILGTYCDTLKSYLLKLKFEGTAPSNEDLKASLAKRALLPLYDAINLVPVILGNTESAPDLEEVGSKEMAALELGEKSPEVWNIFDDLTPAADEILKFEVKRAIESGAI